MGKSPADFDNARGVSFQLAADPVQLGKQDAYPTCAPRRLIVNADDLGLSPGVNRGIFESHRRGIVTSASLLVRWPAAADGVAISRDFPMLSLGLHVDLGEWAYRDGQWRALYEVVPASDESAVRQEVAWQVNRFRELTGRNPTHLDSHQHIHRDEPLRSILKSWSEELSIPLRSVTPYVQYCGAFYGQTGQGEPFPEAIRSESLIRVLSDLPPGVTELGCHPGYDDGLNTMYRHERAEEVKTLCDPAVRMAIEELGIELTGMEKMSRNELRAPLSPLRGEGLGVRG